MWTIGLGMSSASRILIPCPPQKRTTFIKASPKNPSLRLLPLFISGKQSVELPCERGPIAGKALPHAEGNGLPVPHQEKEFFLQNCCVALAHVEAILGQS